MKRRVLILCTGNSARSQMAEGLLRRFGGKDCDIFSAGTHPSSVNPLAIEAMQEIGIDISSHRSKSVKEFADQEFDVVITVCDSAAEHCPVFPCAPQRIHWSVPDPVALEGSREENLAAFRSVREDLAARLSQFLQSA
jgi:arsenate reductase